MSEGEWRLTRSFASSSGRVVYDTFGAGPPVVLVHGTPSWSYLWRGVAGRLASDFTVFVYDLPGFGMSERRADQDVSLPAHATLGELLQAWGLERPYVVGHDIGGAITLRLAVTQQWSFDRLVLCDAVAIAPWITPFTRHVRRYLEAFQTVPEYIHREMVAAHLRSAFARRMSDEDLAPYLTPLTGADGQAAYYRQIAQLDEDHTREIEPRYQQLTTPTLVLWGERDNWLAPATGRQLAETIPDARWAAVPDAGHFAPEDQPDAVAEHLAGFFVAATA